jgi:hypothetical protein
MIREKQDVHDRQSRHDMQDKRGARRLGRRALDVNVCSPLGE